MSDIRVIHHGDYTNVLIEPVPYTVATAANLLLVLHPDAWEALKEAVREADGGGNEPGKEE